MRRMQENARREKATGGRAMCFRLLCGVMSLSFILLIPDPAGAQEVAPLKPYTAISGAYRVGLPAGWEPAWSPAPNATEPTELQLAAPDQMWPNHVVIRIEHYASPHRTPQRYLYDIENPTIGGKEDVRSPVAAVTVAGTAASALDIATYRYPLPGMAGEKVAAFVRHVVVPARSGFFVFRYEAPASIAASYRATFERLVASFVPNAPTAAVAQEAVTDREYEVLAAFFKSPSPKGQDVPEYFDAAVSGRYVVGRTLTPRKARTATWPNGVLGDIKADLVDDYWDKNRKEWLLTDRILVPDLKVASPEDVSAQFSAGLRGKGGANERLLYGGAINYVSRVGFNRAADAALFSVAFNYPRAMSARYLVLMRKQDGAWRLIRAAMESLIYQ